MIVRKVLTEIKANLLDCFYVFMESQRRNAWLEVDHCKLYVRKSHRVMGDMLLPAIDIAHVILQEPFQNLGFFTDFLLTLADEFPDQNFYVENASEQMARVCVKCGFTEIPPLKTSLQFKAKCFYKLRRNL